MEVTFFLGKILGLYILIVGIAVLFRRKMFVHLMREYMQADNTVINYVTAVFVLAVGLALVLGHNIWVGGFLPVTVTILGWLVLAKALALLFLPRKTFAKFLKWIEKKKIYITFGVAYVILGAYLTYLAFTL